MERRRGESSLLLRAGCIGAVDAAPEHYHAGVGRVIPSDDVL